MKNEVKPECFQANDDAYPLCKVKCGEHETCNISESMIETWGENRVVLVLAGEGKKLSTINSIYTEVLKDSLKECK